ncbi:MAG: hypothetical protein GY941_12830 [Planctomycetes bacterium]|nr:hypothetical protein [Planctomycetota bacterium]
MGYLNTPTQKPQKLLKRQEKNVRASVAGEATTIMQRLVDQAKGELMIRAKDEIGNFKRDINNKYVLVPGDMTPMEMKASEIFLRKVLPDLSMVQAVERDSTDGMGRDELTQLLVGMVANNPQLALVTGLDQAINQEKTVKTIP